MKKSARISAFGAISFAVLFLLVGGFFSETTAQPQLNFKRIINNWPRIELYFSVGCNGQPAYFTDKNYFKVYENGVEIADFDLWCPNPATPCRISVALAFDASGSMSGERNAGAKAAGNAFVDLMDGTNDEACIMWYNTQVTLALGMTKSKSMLKTAINSLPASGGAGGWDAMYDGITELIQNGSNQCRAVIVLTDGLYSTGVRTASECISLANRNRIRVFPIGLVGPVSETELRSVADQTGGKYYFTSDPTALASLYEEILPLARKGFEECCITYTAKCMDGALRTVDLSLVNFCGGSDTKTKTYKALLDTTTFVPVTVKLGKQTVRGNTTATIPLTLETALAGDAFHGFEISILYDENCAQFTKIETPPGTLLNNSQFTTTPIPGGVLLKTLDKKIINGAGVLAELSFKASDPDGKDTINCPVQLASWKFGAGCLKPVLANGEIRIVPRRPNLKCGHQHPKSLVWSQSLKDYDPNPFTFVASLSNIGDGEAKNVRFQLIYNKSDLTLEAPTSDYQVGNPLILDPGGKSEARWDIRAKKRIAGDSVEFCVISSFDNYDSFKCCMKIWIPAADAALGCKATAPQITPDNINIRYVPMPFEVLLDVWNEGGKRTDTVFARIVLPPGDLRLAGADAPDRKTKKVTPPLLNPGQNGGVSWLLSHPITLTEKEYNVGSWVRTSNADSSYCEVKIVIPAIQAPILSPKCAVPDSLTYNSVMGTYIPNPFQIALTCVNVGSLTASQVTGFVYLPANVELVNPVTDPLRKTFNPSTLDPYTTGDPIPRLTWNVRLTKQFKNDTTLEFKFMVGGFGPTGIPTDSAEIKCYVRVKGVKSVMDCDLAIPDSLMLNTQKTGVEPNPFMVTYRVWDKRQQTVIIRTVNLKFQPDDGMALDPTTPSTKVLDTLLRSIDTLSVSWIVHVQNRSNDREPEFTATATIDQENPIWCERKIFMQAAPAMLSCAIKPDNLQILYERDKKEYVPKEWVISQSLTAGVVPLNNVRGTISWTDPSGLNLVDWNPAFPDNTNPKLRSFLQANDSVLFEWGFMMKNPNTSGQKQTITFDVVYSSDETPPSPQQKCSAVAVVDTQVTVGVDKSGKELSYCLYQNHPNPFNPSTVIEYEVPEAIHVRLVVYDALGREVRMLVNERKEAGRHGIVFNSGDLPSGVYTYKLETSKYVESRKMILMR